MSAHRDSLTRTTAMLGIALVVLTIFAMLWRIPSGWNTLDQQALRNRSATDSALAAADSIDVDNPLASAAVQLIPRDSSFAVLAPAADAQKRDGISPVTAFALPGYFQYLLMPRRETSLAAAQYVVCYDCSRADISRPVTWIYTSDPGLGIGRLGR